MRHEKPAWSFQFEDGRKACVLFTTKDHGDLSIDQDPQVLASRQRSIVDERWAYLTQVHGTEVVHVESPGECQGRSGDAILTGAPSRCLPRMYLHNKNNFHFIIESLANLKSNIRITTI